MLRLMDGTDTVCLTVLRKELMNRAAAFARSHIATRHDLRDQTIIPPKLWQALGDAGLAQIALPTGFGCLLYTSDAADE